MEVIGITGGRQWFHQTRTPNAADYTLIASGIIPPENFRPDNNLLLIAFNQNGLFFINGNLTARLDLSHNLNHGEINIMSGFFNTHPGEPSLPQLHRMDPLTPAPPVPPYPRIC